MPIICVQTRTISASRLTRVLDAVVSDPIGPEEHVRQRIEQQLPPTAAGLML